jgi:hypothetical protein
VFMFGGAASGRLQHTGIVLSYAAFPLALLTLQVALERRSHVVAVGFAISAGSIALGRNQVAFLLCMMLLAAGMADVWCSPKPTSYLRERSGVLTTIVIVCGALMVVPILLTLQFAVLSNRPAEGLDDALRGSLYPANLATLVVPNIFGTHASYWGPGASNLADVALTDDSENYLFVGSVPILLVLWLGSIGGGALRPGRRLTTATLVITCLFMLGRYTPFYGLAFCFVPGIDLFRRPTDASFVFDIALAILTGHFLADYIREGLPRKRPFTTFAVVSGLLAVIGSAVLFSSKTGHSLDAARESALAGAVMLAVILTMHAGARRPLTRVVAAGLVTCVAIAELICWNAASRLNAESRSLYAVLETPTGAEAAAIVLLESTIMEDHRRGDYPRVEVLGLGGPWQNLAMVRGWEATNGYNPLRIGIYDRLVSPGEENWDVGHRQFPPSFANYNCALAQALGLTYLILGQPLDRLPVLPAPPVADLLLPGPPVWIYRLSGASARVRISASSVAAGTDSLGLVGTSADWVPEDKQIAPSRPTALPSAEYRGVARIESLTPDRVEAVVTSAEGGLLVLRDIYYPGWFAEVDGKPTPVQRADILFRAVKVPPGIHRVILRLAPFSLANLRAGLNAVLRHKEGQP